MEPPAIQAFADAAVHEAVSTIIRRRSTNRADIRDVVLGELDLRFAREILDLGCGFGFMAEAVAGRSAPGARIIGVDACPAYDGPFQARVEAAGGRAEFLPLRIADELPWPAESFDLVISSYSLYFMVEVLPEIARVVAPAGLFLALTHSERSFRGLLLAAGIPPETSPLLKLPGRFSAENGREILQRWFGEIACVPYANTLLFEAGHLSDLLAYFRFKLPLLEIPADADGGIPDTYGRALAARLAQGGRVVVEKDDACFRCRRPRCP